MDKHKKDARNGAYIISDLATEFDISSRTIRFYKEKGLISPREPREIRGSMTSGTGLVSNSS